MSLIVMTVGAFALFQRRQATAAEPVLPLSLFKVRELRYGCLCRQRYGLRVRRPGTARHALHGHRPLDDRSAPPCC
ncbi:hypothetical protein ACFVYE_23225 [Streptomyces sp. NPDC058239]|uniref:hypothetical protein n=1 Tax=unclassified Streptomyces TaxID=2593676 RepID=UPI00364DA318